MLANRRLGSATKGYRIETVQDCATETQTGFQNRRDEQIIDAAALRTSLAVAPHLVSDHQHAALAVKVPDIQLDPGERSLWAHAFHRTDDWMLCGPDKASLRMGVRLGYRDRLMALETLLVDAGFRPPKAYEINFTATWHSRVVSQFVVMETRT